jgi:hypothetical protein
MKVIDEQGNGDYIHWCPGCKCFHLINTTRKNDNNAQWRFDGNVNQPTFSPSINIVGMCHYFIRQGKIEYCSDSKHSLAGQTIELPNVNDYL